MVRRPNLASKEWVYRQYDTQVLAGTVVPPGSDAAVVRVDSNVGGSTKGIALSAGCNSRFCELDPFEGARLAVAEVCRNLAVVGAEPIGLTDCLNFGNPEKPEIMWADRGSHPRAERRLPGPRRAHRLWQREPLQRDRRAGDHAHPGRGRSRLIARRPRRGAQLVHRAGRPHRVARGQHRGTRRQRASGVTGHARRETPRA